MEFESLLTIVFSTIISINAVQSGY